jgi:hypothetical protein
VDNREVEIVDMDGLRSRALATRGMTVDAGAAASGRSRSPRRPRALAWPVPRVTGGASPVRQAA